MPIVYSLSYYHTQKVIEELVKKCPENVKLLVDADVDLAGIGIMRITPIPKKSDRSVKRACWVGFVIGNQLMITLGDQSNFHRYKHDPITPHHNWDMDAVWLSIIKEQGSLKFDYAFGAEVILSWITSGVKLRKGD